MIELLGFVGRLVAAGLMRSSPASSFVLAAKFRNDLVAPDETADPSLRAKPKHADPTRWRETILFTTGFASLAMEVVWVRGFTHSS